MSDMLLEPLAESSCDLRVIDSAKHSSFFCAIAVFYVPPCKKPYSSTIETQRTLRLHREELRQTDQELNKLNLHVPLACRKSMYLPTS